MDLYRYDGKTYLIIGCRYRYWRTFFTMVAVYIFSMRKEYICSFLIWNNGVEEQIQKETMLPMLMESLTIKPMQSPRRLTRKGRYAIVGSLNVMHLFYRIKAYRTVSFSSFSSDISLKVCDDSVNRLVFSCSS